MPVMERYPGVGLQVIRNREARISKERRITQLKAVATIHKHVTPDVGQLTFISLFNYPVLLSKVDNLICVIVYGLRTNTRYRVISHVVFRELFK